MLFFLVWGGGGFSGGGKSFGDNTRDKTKKKKKKPKPNQNCGRLSEEWGAGVGYCVCERQLED